MFKNQGPVAQLERQRSPKRFLTYSKSVVSKAKGSTSVSYAGLAELEADVIALDKAETAAKDRTPAAVADRDAKALKVYQGLHHYRDYVQSLAEAQATPADAVTLILNLGLTVRKSRSYAKPALAAKYGGVSGEVLLAALAVVGAGAYYWEWSIDQKSWSSAPETTTASTSISGLTPGQLYYFRFRALTPKGKGNYSQVVSLMMH